MQLASHGGRASLRRASNFAPHLNIRSIHIPRGPPPSTITQRIVSQSRHLFSRFIANLTAPGLSAPTANHAFTRAAHTSGQAAIRNGLSLPVRVALSRPFGAPTLPRAPAAIPRGIAQVGLGTARNFHSSRPIFQNLVENVPIVGRAIYEADWDIKLRGEKDSMLRSIRKEKKKKSGSKPKALKVSPPFIKVPAAVLEKETDTTGATSTSQELDHYFPDPTPAVITTLLIPLAPTPTSRMPLSTRSQDQHVLPLQEMLNVHSLHSTHSLRVSALFSRLDAANFWERGVRCSAFSHGNDSAANDAVCTILKVEFIGWSKAEVRSVIGESGSGWCVLEEIQEDDDDLESLLSDSHHPEEEDASDDHVTQSFVFPTLDMSMTAFSPPSSPFHTNFSPPSGLNSPGFGSESEWGSSFSPSEHSIVEPPSSNGYFGFSSSFAERMSEAGWEDVAAPREYMF